MEKPIRILIIEDNESDSALIIRHLKKAEMNITCKVIDTEQGMKSALEQHEWDFVICDYSLPQFNAIQALKALQATKIDIPFIVVSATVGEETAVELMKAGVNDYIMKDNLAKLVPVFNRELLEAGIRREHKLAEEKINVQAHILDLIGQSVIMVDTHNKITYWNNASKALYGWSAEEVIGKDLSEIMTHHDLQYRSSDIRKCIINGESWSRETNVINKDGASIPTHVTHTPLLDENGFLTGVIGISFDISERRKAEEAIIRKMDELATSNEELSRINRLTIGREMRMIELKQQCNNLASQLGIAQPYPLTFINETVEQKEK
jgi:two-component system, cell cycle sensor histidine kinase and response regulator CckA